MKTLYNVKQRFYENNNQPPQGGNQPGQGGNNGNGENNQPPQRPNPMVFIIVAAITLLVISYFLRATSGETLEEITYNEFIEMINQESIEEVTITSDRLLIEPKKTGNGYGPTKVYYTGIAENITEITSRLLKHDITVQSEVEDGSSVIISILLTYVLPIILMWVLLSLLFRKMSRSGGMGFGVGKSNAKVYGEKETGVTFKDVAGEDEAKESLVEVVDFLHNPEKYSKIGAKLPKGALLVGPPGTGKTLLAKAVAGEANVPFLSMSGSDFVEMFVGVGAARVRDLFKQAKEKAPCIIFIDEIDAVGRARGKNPNMGSNDERENTLNQMLTEMDGFGTNNGVIILAATNRADMLDKALLRPGRFDRQIYVDLPELSDRVEIFNVHLRKIKVNASLDIESLARQTQGFSGADIANVCNEAALIAARNNKTEVTIEDFNSAIDRIVGGLEKRSRVYTEEEKKIIATHEAGHATVSWMTEYGRPLLKVTIVPRGQALGAAWYEGDNRQLMPEQFLKDQICSLLAGRAAEELFVGEISTGASNDLERANKTARAMVVYYGFSDKLPNISFLDSSGQDYGFTKPYSADTEKLIDSEVQRIINEQYERAKDILKQHVTQHNEMRDMLIEREVIYTADVKAILGPRKWKSRSEEIVEITEKMKEDKKALGNDSEGAGTPPPLSEKE